MANLPIDANSDPALRNGYGSKITPKKNMDQAIFFFSCMLCYIFIDDFFHFLRVKAQEILDPTGSGSSAIAKKTLCISLTTHLSVCVH